MQLVNFARFRPWMNLEARISNRCAMLYSSIHIKQTPNHETVYMHYLWEDQRQRRRLSSNRSPRRVIRCFGMCGNSFKREIQL